MGIVGILFVLRANIRNSEAFKERAKAYYLCETGASIAILDIRNGRIGNGSGQWTEHAYNYSMGGTTYSISYKVEKERGAWLITSWVGPASGFSRTYKLKVGGQRAFPIFIRGFPGK
jgi:hypothetical protein